MHFNKEYSIYLTSFMDMFAVSVAVTHMSPYLRSIGISHFIIGLISSLYSGLQFLSGPLIGSWSDIRGRTVVLNTTLVMCSVSYLLLGMTNFLPLFIMARIILGIFKHTQTLSKSLAADIIPRQRHTDVFGKCAAVSGLGFMVGPVIGGHLAELHNGFFYICLFVAVLFLVNIGIVYFSFSDIGEAASNCTSLKESGIADLLKVFDDLCKTDWHTYWDLFALRFLFGFAQSSFYSNYSLYIQEHFQGSSLLIGYTISVQGLIAALLGFSASFVEKLYPQNTESMIMAFHGFILFSLSFIAISVMQSIKLFILCLIPMSACASFLRIMLNKMIVERTKADNVGSVIGTSNSVASISRFAAPLCSGVFIDIVGMKFLPLMSSVGAAFGIILTARLLWLKRKND